MGTITPILDTLLPQVLGRAGDVARIGERAAHGPLSALRPVSGEMSPLARPGVPARPRPESSAGSVRGAAATGTRSHPADAGPSGARDASQAMAPGAGRASAQLHLSRGGNALARLLGDVGLKADSPAAPAVTRAQPLAVGAPRAPALAPMLAQQVTGSGLFYESHLAAWVRGQFPLARLIDESKTRLGPDSGSGSGATAGGSQASSDAGASQSAATASIDPRLATLVRQQIELLAGGVFQWQGEAWAGVPMRWSIESEREGESAEVEAVAPATTELSLDLPGIGAFEARLRVAGDHVTVTAWAQNGPGRDLVAADLGTLRRRLRDAGFGESSVRLVTEAGT